MWKRKQSSALPHIYGIVNVLVILLVSAKHCHLISKGGAAAPSAPTFQRLYLPNFVCFTNFRACLPLFTFFFDCPLLISHCASG